MKKYTIISLFLGLNMIMNYGIAADNPVKKHLGKEKETETFYSEINLARPNISSMGSASPVPSPFPKRSLIYRNAVTDSEITNRVLGADLAFGRVEALSEGNSGGASVGSSGAANYSVPIMLPPGTNGMMPSLAITYNSMGGNGYLGTGWALSGLSAIRRGHKNLHYDEQVNFLKAEFQDAYYLDGARLVLTGGNSIFKLENEGFSNIEGFNFQASYGGPEYFKVEMKNGLTYEYGNTSDSRNATDQGDVLAWHLNKIEDCNGNYVEFVYEKMLNTNEFRIKEIRYTGNIAAGLIPYNHIKFHYAARNDVGAHYEWGHSMGMSSLLETIEVTGENGLEFMKYHLKYAYEEGHSLLSELSAEGAGNAILNPTLFKYGTEWQKVNRHQSYVNSTFNRAFISGDFNGDGIYDLFHAKYNLSQQGTRTYTDYEIYSRSTYSGSLNLSDSGPILVDEYLPAYQQESNLIFSDYDGNGQDDLLSAEFAPFSNAILSRELEEVTFSFFQNSSFSKTNQTFSFSNYNENIAPMNSNFFYHGDFDGNGVSDILTVLTDEPTLFNNSGQGPGPFDADKTFVVRMLTHDGTGIVYRDVTLNGNDFVQPGRKIFILDYNGDGKSDIMALDGNACQIRTLFMDWTGTLYQDEQLYNGVFSSLQGAPDYFELGDFNGDGKVDFLFEDSNGNWAVNFAKGNHGFETVLFTPSSPLSATFPDQAMKVLDANGDGKSDIVVMTNDQYYTNTDLEVYLSNGKGFEHQLLDNFQPAFVPSNSELVTGDFNGDGRVDLLLTHENNAGDPHYILYMKPNGKERLLQKVSDGYGRITEFDYKLLTADFAFYQKGTDTQYPMLKVRPAINAVQSMTVPDGIGGTRSTHYTYHGAQYHLLGKGFLGYERTFIIDYLRNMETVRDYAFDNTFYFRYQTMETVRYIPGNLISQTDYNYGVIPLYHKGGPDPDGYWLRLNATESRDHVNNHRNTEDFSYDADGNLTFKETFIGLPLLNSSTYTLQTIEQYSNFASSCNGIKAFPQDITITKKRKGSGPNTKLIKKLYSSINGLYKHIDFPGTAEEVITEHTAFDVYGNVEVTQISSPGLLTKTIQYDYESKGRFPKKAYNPLGQDESFSYNPLWGRPDLETSIDGLTTTYTYDAFGRTTSITNGLGVTEEYKWVWDLQTGNGTGTTSVSNALYHLEVTVPDLPDREVYYDIYDRERMSKEVGFNNKWITTITSYDAFGRTKTTTTPFFSNLSPLSVVVTEYAYDDFDRIISTSDPSGTVTTTYPGPLIDPTNTAKHTVYPNGNYSIIETDPSGLVLRAEDKGGVLIYEYNSLGKQIKVEKDNNLLLSMDYDNRGRQTALVDVNAGTYAYQYNAYGELVSETDANSNTHTTVYDVLGRISSKTGPEGTVTYDYVTSGNGLNQLEKMTGFNGITKEYTYTNGNLLRQISVPFLNISVSYQYHSNGKERHRNYSSGVGVSTLYDDNGYVKKMYAQGMDFVNQMTPNPTLIFEGIRANPYKRYTEYNAGNGVTSYVSYNDYGYPIFYDGGSGLTQYLQLDWDMATGNLSSRTDHIHNLTEDFTYDDMNRLTEVNIQGGATTNLNFMNSGNVLSKDELGFYAYANMSDDFSVERIANNNTPISLQTQQLTYTSFNEPDQITEGNFNMDFIYGPDYQRIRSIIKENGQVEQVRSYLPEVGYESLIVDNIKKHIHYVPFGDKLGLIIVRCEPVNGGDSGGNGSGGEIPENEHGDRPDDPQDPTFVITGCNQDYTYFYVYSDHLGSILSLTNDAGHVILEQSFDAWGRYRNPSTWNYAAGPTIADWLLRGYTGHEKLDEFDLIHMNGRLYDPKTSQMLSPDNYVQSPYNTQSYNRYAYAFDNPLRYTDPSGELFNIPGAIGGAYAGGSIANNSFDISKWDLKNPGTYAGIVAGALAGGFGGEYIVSKMGTKAYNAALYSGTTNAFSNYESGQRASATLGYFGAGFLAQLSGAQGLSGGTAAKGDHYLAAMGAGAMFNLVAASAAGDVEFDDPYTMLQAMVGGALNAYGGMDYYNHSIGEKGLVKSQGGKFWSSGIKALASDFAHTPKDKFLKKNLGQHGGTFVNSGIGGLMQANTSQMIAGGTSWDRFTLSSIFYGMEYGNSLFIKNNYQHGKADTKGWGAKVGANTFKAIMYTW